MLAEQVSEVLGVCVVSRTDRAGPHGSRRHTADGHARSLPTVKHRTELRPERGWRVGAEEPLSLAGAWGGRELGFTLVVVRTAVGAARTRRRNIEAETVSPCSENMKETAGLECDGQRGPSVAGGHLESAVLGPKRQGCSPEVWVHFWGEDPGSHRILRETQIPERFGVSLARISKLSVVKT